MGRFSQRMGYTPVKEAIQVDEMDADLRSGLWNVYEQHHVQRFSRDAYLRFLREAWRDYFKRPADRVSVDTSVDLRRLFLSVWPWYEVYDYIEYTVNWWTKADRAVLVNEFNKVLEKELSGYRFVGDRLAPITSEDELAAIEQAVAVNTDTVSQHLQAALALFSDRQQPDYRNSIKESISAVEALATRLDDTGQKTLGPALDRVGKLVAMHRDMKEGFQKLYSYTNDSNGIRHALMDTPNLDSDDAKFMLVACSAFINYLVAKATKAGIVL
jgi:hypothetical protein